MLLDQLIKQRVLWLVSLQVDARLFGMAEVYDDLFQLTREKQNFILSTSFDHRDA